MVWDSQAGWSPSGERRKSRTAVLWRSEQTALSSANDDEVGGFQVRGASSLQKEWAPSQARR
jgi:hypothetical protein